MPVGIVLVSHSAILAEGAAQLAHAMTAGSDIALSIAAGIDDPDNPLGTDALRVMAAIDEVYSEDGVLVLMDLGSAVLSAEFALDLIGPEKAANIRLSEAPFIEGLLAAMVQISAGGTLDSVAREASGGLAAKLAHLGTDPVTMQSVDDRPLSPAGPAAELEVDIALPHGLHARPASHIVRAASGYDATVTLEDRTARRGPVSAMSLNSIMTLGVLRGHRVLFQANGPEAQAAIAAIAAIAADNFGEGDAPAATTPRPAQATEATPSASAHRPSSHVPATLAGLPGSAGIGIGELHLLLPDTAETEIASSDDPAAESERLRIAVAAVDDTLRLTAASSRPEIAEIVETQRLLLSDPVLIDAALTIVATDRVTAESGWRRAIAQTASSYRSLGDEYLAARAVDVESIGTEVVHQLRGGGQGHSPLSGIVGSVELSTAQAAALDPDLVAGIVVAEGSPSSHTAIIARTLGIPAVLGVGFSLFDVPDGTTLIVNGETGRVEVAPNDEALAAASTAADERARQRLSILQQADQPVLGRDGTEFAVMANIGSVEDARRAHANGADGIGLVRTEFLFVDRLSAPDEDEQFEVYSQICAAMKGRTVVFRTLDVGGDKPLPYLRRSAELNPDLGLRGIRLGLANPDMLRTQLRALLRTAEVHPVRIMLPMVSDRQEITDTAELLEETRQSLIATGRVLPSRTALGTMVETPALALKVAAGLPEVAFLSLGTNDLVQYLMAAERGNADVASLYDVLDPAVLSVINQVSTGARDAGLSLTVCGSASEDVAALTVMAGLGIREFSVPPPQVPEVKHYLRRLDLDAASRLAHRALDAGSATEIRKLLAEHLDALTTEDHR